MLEFKFHVAMPIFVARQWIRHRTASVNEYSARYSILPDRFYTPTLENVRKQSSANRQGGAERFAVGEIAPQETATAEEFLKFLDDVEALYPRYAALLDKGVSRELARIGLPVNMYTEWYWKCDLHNILRFLSLRMDAHAQEEIRVYADAMYALLQPIVPITMEAFRDYELESVHLTKLELDALRDAKAGGAGQLATENKREQAEWANQARKARPSNPRPHYPQPMPDAPTPKRPIEIKVENLRRSFGQQVVLDGVSLEINNGGHRRRRRGERIGQDRAP